jgi:LysM repeat protein
MRKNPYIFLCLLLLTSFQVKAQQSAIITEYIAAYKDLAIAEMQRTGVPAAITLAQGIHESGAGMGKLVQASNNHFGIKCKSNWTGESVRHDDDARGECFRKYPKPEDSYRDHSDFLKNGQRYAFLFDLDPEDYVAWANGLKKAGYATNPKYPQVLIKTVEDYGLQQYTYIGLGKNPVITQQDEMTVVENKTPVSETVAPVSMPVPAAAETVKKQTYPEGLFHINETKVIYAKKGTSYFTIAKQYTVDLSKIFEFNEIARAEETATDQLVYLQRKRKTGAAEFHIVQPGETLHDIAQQQAIRLESLRELNWLKENERPVPGVQLSLKKKSANMPKLAVKENYSIYSGKKNKN